MPRTALDFQPVNSDVVRGARKWKTITPSDGADLEFVTRAIWVGVAGNVAIIGADDEDGESIVIQNVPVGQWVVQARRVLASGTTASGLRYCFG